MPRLSLVSVEPAFQADEVGTVGQIGERRLKFTVHGNLGRAFGLNGQAGLGLRPIGAFLANGTTWVFLQSLRPET